MRWLHYTALLTLFASPAFAEGAPATSPMRYTKIRNTAPEDTTHIKTRTINHDDSEGADAKAEEDTPRTRIWNKYKALASGEAGEVKEEKKEPEKEEQPETAETPKTIIEKEPAAPTGIAGLIEEYKRNKAQRSQMHTITVTPEKETKEEKPQG